MSPECAPVRMEQSALTSSCVQLLKLLPYSIPSLCLRRCLLSGTTNGCLLTTTGATVCTGSLATAWQVILVTKGAVGVDVLKALNISCYNTLKFTFNHVLVVNNVLDARNFCIC